MLSQRHSVYRNKRGGLVRVVKEHYLRDDLGCGYLGCAICHDAHPCPGHLDTDAACFLIPDTNIVLSHIDLLEHASVKNVIVLQTVLEEVRHRNTSIHDRLRKLVADPDKRFVVFCNEHHRETYRERLPEESANDRNDRVIRVAVTWYNGHVGKPVLLITHDAENRRIAESESIPVKSIREHVETMKNHSDLLDIVAQGEHAATAAMDDDRRFTAYLEHLTPLQINHGIKSGTLLQGSLNISSHNYLEGSIFAKINGQERTVLILGRQHMNRAIHGDQVAVQLLPEAEWRRTPTVVVQDENEEVNEEQDEQRESKTVAEAMSDDSHPVQPTGKVMGIIRRHWRQYCGYLDPRSVRSGTAVTWQNVLLFPMDRRIPKIRLRTRQAEHLVGQRLLVAIDAWTAQSRYPVGHFVRKLGVAGDRAAETEVLLLEHDVAYQEFSKSVLSTLPPEGEAWVVREEHFVGRRDLRALNVCSIDPPGCTDIDDALHVYPLPNDIADVTHFVKPGTAMDAEAASRGTTVYLVDKRIDMLPALLGTNLCSLRSNVERLAFSCIWELTPEAEIVNVEFTKSVIASKASLTYEQAQNRIDDPSMQDDLTKGIRILNQLAKKLRAARVQRGALTLASPEVRFQLENDSQDPVDVEMKELKETNALVEEFMLLANISVARRIQERFPETAMLRRHPTPPETNFEQLVRAVKRLGIELKHGSSKELSDSLDKAEPYFNKLLRIMTTRCMMQARYFPSGAEPDAWHYGLACDIYTHFTSPIRRYADVIVHRQLAICIGADAPDATSTLGDTLKMRQLTDNLNYRHRNAQQAGRSSVELYTHLFFRGKIIEEEAWVIRVLKNGFVALIPRYGIEGIVYSQGQDASLGTLLEYDTETDALLTKDKKVKIQLFTKVTVRVTVESEGAVQGMREKLRVMLVRPEIPGLSVPAQEKKVGGLEVKKGREVTDEEERIIKRVKTDVQTLS